jgi:hypothetical protein
MICLLGIAWGVTTNDRVGIRSVKRHLSQLYTQSINDGDSQTAALHLSAALILTCGAIF